MTDENFFAWTPAGATPPYISVNLRDASGVEITIRSERQSEASLTVPLDRLDGMIDGLRRARSRLIDEASYEDLRASGGIVGAPASDSLSHDDLCYLSRVFCEHDWLKEPRGIRINEWLKRLIALSRAQKDSR